MGTDTYLIIPTRAPARAKRMLEEQSQEVAHVGRDYLVLYKGERYVDVERSPETWGLAYAKDLPASIRKGLDPRGLLARPAGDEDFAATTYAAEVQSQKPPLFLPTRRAPASAPNASAIEKPTKSRKERRLILISLSPAREKILLEDPEIVHEIVSERRSTPIPGSLEFDERWIALQRALFDFLWQYGAEDERAEALAPRSGESLYDEGGIDAARLIPAERARRVAQWITELPEDVLARVARKATPSPASRTLPEPARGAVDPKLLTPELERLQSFYGELLRTGRAVLSIRFRE